MSFLIDILPSIIVSIFMLFFTYKFNKQMKRRDELDEHRRKESQLQLELQLAVGKLSYGVAIAIKNGHPNGEIEEAEKAYEKAKHDYQRFLMYEGKEYLS